MRRAADAVTTQHTVLVWELSGSSDHLLRADKDAVIWTAYNKTPLHLHKAPQCSAKIITSPLGSTYLRCGFQSVEGHQT